MLLKTIRLITTSILLCTLACALAACRNQQENHTYTDPPVISTTKAEPTTAAPVTQAAPVDSELPEIDTYVILDDVKTTIHGKGAEFKNGVLSITDGGAYHLEGSLSDGKLYINSSNETKKVKLILAGVSISCSTDAPLYVENSLDETVLILKRDTQNTFTDTARTVDESETDYATAAIYSKDDLQIEGSGNLTVNGKFNKGIFSKNDIDIRGGHIEINSVDDGIRGKESIEIEAGEITISCGGDGIRTSEESEADKGDIDIHGGVISITSALDAIQATGNLTVSGGSITAVSAGGATENAASQHYRDYNGREKSFGFMSGKHPDSSMLEQATVNEPSTKGIKAAGSINLNGGVISLNCLDDSIHAPVVTVNGGNITLSSNDDGIHADEALTVNNGNINILTSNEGIEGRTVSINGGEIILNARDDGINAASDDTKSAEPQNSPQSRDFPGMKPGGPGGMMDYDSSCVITMTDGFVLINAQGDGIDSNGDVNMSGGKMIVFGPTSGGNSALDYGGSFNISGGTVFASGSLGMAQSVTGNGVPVLNFNFSGAPDTVYALADSFNNCKIAFTAPKAFENVVFASDTLSASETYSFYESGTVSPDGQEYNGICFGGSYTPGVLLKTMR